MTASAHTTKWFAKMVGLAGVLELNRSKPGLFALLFCVALLSCGPQGNSPGQGSEEAANAPAVIAPAMSFPEHFSVYIPMSDGIRLAAEIYLPVTALQVAPVPGIVEFTRYWRADVRDPPETELPIEVSKSLAAGYAYVIVDVRGTGASEGVRKAEFSLAEARDMPQVIDWMSSQQWSNGKVASLGSSYSGNTAEMAALFRSPALVAAVPRFTDFDWYTSIVVPGGLKNSFITVRWGEAVHKLDLNDASLFGDHEYGATAANPVIRGVRPVETDVDGSILAAASLAHAENSSLADQLATLVYRDEYPSAASVEDSGDAAVSIHAFRTAFEQSALPMYQWASWFDAGTAAGVLSRFAEWDAPYRYIIGAWSHGGGHDANPYAGQDLPPQPTVDEQFADIFAFLDPLMKADPPGPPPVRELVYFTVGENVWKTTRVWPPAGQVMERWWFQPDHGLAATEPHATDGFDSYTVDFEAGSGISSRWATQLGGGDVFYGDRTAADEKLLTYTSAPLASDVEITGSAVISLEVSSTHEDGAFIAYLEDVAPDGYVRMLAEGELRALHRAVSDTPAYENFGPFHSFERKDGAPMVPGEITSLSFALLPVSVLLGEGHAIRVSIAGHDKDTFLPVPENLEPGDGGAGSGAPAIRVYRQKSNASWIDLPVIQPVAQPE